VSESPHELVNPSTLSPPIGFAHAVAAAAGRLVFLGGQTSHDAEGVLRGETVAQQFDLALQNVVTALDAAGGRPEHLVSIQIYVTDAEAYRSSLAELGTAYRRHLGRHYPAMALFEVASLFDPAAKVEVLGVAVVP
jgi:enamine deaminase RidA (YjgF/YER057c/UK114 family)